MFYREEEFEKIAETVVLVDYSPGCKLGDFDCGIQDYNEFIVKDAPHYILQNICGVRLLLDKVTDEVIAYIAMSTDAFTLDKEEKKNEKIEVPFNSVPALKIGKLAVSKKYKDKPYGSFMLFVSLGYLEQLNEMGIGCRFLVVDADIEFNPETPEFYEKNGFIYNEKMNKNRTKNKSMRYDIFQD